ncbi:hypothetical protein PCAR4_540042 [Paraburkholderia caribensis]|nr:hypothetical protein PCAR4_540042 [Paraburkholderia caribensis]
MSSPALPSYVESGYSLAFALSFISAAVISNTIWSSRPITGE